METSCKNLVQENQDVVRDLLIEEEDEAVMSPVASSALHILQLPDSIVLQIFTYLPFYTVGAVAQVCRRWNQISYDELLWRHVFVQHYKLPSKTTMPPKATSWRSEFKRLYYHTPAVLSEERKEHKDEVLHVSFSHDGTMFATCSKDGFFKVWECTHPVRLLFKMDMKSSFSWKFTQFSQFNETDTCLLVSGVYFGRLSTSGEIAVFNLQDDFRMQCRVTNKPYDVFGAWYDNDHLLSGTLYWTGDFNSVSAVWLSKASQEVESEVESVSMVLYRFENVNSSSIRLLHVAEVDRDVDLTSSIQDKYDQDFSGSALTSPHSSILGLEDDARSASDMDTVKRKRPEVKAGAQGQAEVSEEGTCILDQLLRKYIAEDEFDLENEDKTDEEDEVEENAGCNVKDAQGDYAKGSKGLRSEEEMEIDENVQVLDRGQILTSEGRVCVDQYGKILDEDPPEFAMPVENLVTKEVHVQAENLSDANGETVPPAADYDVVSRGLVHQDTNFSGASSRMLGSMGTLEHSYEASDKNKGPDSAYDPGQNFLTLEESNQTTSNLSPSEIHRMSFNSVKVDDDNALRTNLPLRTVDKEDSEMHGLSSVDIEGVCKDSVANVSGSLSQETSNSQPETPQSSLALGHDAMAQGLPHNSACSVHCEPSLTRPSSLPSGVRAPRNLGNNNAVNQQSAEAGTSKNATTPIGSDISESKLMSSNVAGSSERAYHTAAASQCDMDSHVQGASSSHDSDFLASPSVPIGAEPEVSSQHLECSIDKVDGNMNNNNVPFQFDDSLVMLIPGASNVYGHRSCHHVTPNTSHGVVHSSSHNNNASSNNNTSGNDSNNDLGSRNDHRCSSCPEYDSINLDLLSREPCSSHSLKSSIATQTDVATSRASSLHSLSHMSHSSSLSRDLHCSPPREKLLIYTWGSETYIPHKVGIKRMRWTDFSKVPFLGEVKARRSSMLLPDVMENLHNMAGNRRDTPDVTIEMHGHIVGLSLSPDHKFLYVNCRPWPKNYIISDPQESPPLAQEVEISTIDLTTFNFVGPVLRSHKAYTHSDECFFLNLDVSDDYVASGAEDRQGYLWDRHYGIPLYRFPHRNVVNCVAINPQDPEVLVTVSDDYTFKVWMSRCRASERTGSKPEVKDTSV